MSLSPFQARLRGAAVWVAGIAAAVLALRAALGPYRIPLAGIMVNSPFRAESILWICALVLLLMRTSAVRTSAEGLHPGRYLAVVLCIIALAFVRNLSDSFLSDDYVLLNVGPFNWSTFLGRLLTPGGDGSWRPFGYVYYAVIRTFAGTSPLKWHALGLGIHLANSALIFRIAWKLWRSTAAAVLTCAVFGLNGTRPEAALWTAGNYDLLAALCVLTAVSVAASERISVNSGLLISMLLVAAGIFFKESAYAAPFVLGGILAGKKSFRRFTVASLVTCSILFAWRWHVFGGPGGYADPVTGNSMILSLHLLPTAKALAGRIWSILLLPLNWDAPAHWWLPVAVAAGSLGLIFLLKYTRNDSTRQKTRLALIAATIGAVLPAAHLALIGQSALGSRVLYLPGVAFALLIGSTAVGAARFGIVAACIMILGTAGILENNLSAWHDASVKAKALCARGAAGIPVTPEDTFEGVYFFRDGLSGCVATERALARATN